MTPAQQYADALKPVKRAKYGNRRTVVDGVSFDSAKEAARWSTLKLLVRAGKIKLLRRQVRVPLTVRGTCCGHYVADFEYMDNEKDDLVWEDTKSPATQKLALFVLKSKLIKAIYGREIVIS